MSVFDLKPGEQATVTGIGARGAVRQRLMDMGLLPNVQVRVERVAPRGGPVWINMQGCQLALRRTEAESIQISGG